jgi:hypothetical protein
MRANTVRRAAEGKRHLNFLQVQRTMNNLKFVAGLNQAAFASLSQDKFGKRGGSRKKVIGRHSRCNSR